MIITESTIGNEFIGIDPGLAHLGLSVVRVTPKGLELKHCERVNTYTNKALGARLRILWDKIAALVNENTHGIGCESPSYGSKSAPYSLGAVHGIVHLIADANSLPVVKVAPLQLHKFATSHVAGKGRTKEEKAAYMKAQVRICMAENFGYDYSEVTHSDPVDASAIGTIAAIFFSDIKLRKRHQAEVLSAIKIYTNFN